MAFVLGYATDVLGIAPVGLYTCTYVATFVLARAAGVRLATQTTWMQVLLAGAFALLQSTMVLVLLAIFGRDAWAPRSLYPLALPHAIATASVAPIVFRFAQAVHVAAGNSTRGRRAGGVGVTNLLVPRSDVGEFRRRYRWMALAAVVAFLVILARLFQLQALDGAAYAAIAHENIIRRVVLPTTRGVIRDANGKVLASSRPSYDVEIVPGRVMPSARPVRYRNGQPIAHDPDSWPRLADALRLNPEERRTFEARIRAACVSDDDKSPCWHTPILVREDVSRDTVAELKQHRDELAGVDVVGVPVRFYPYKSLGAHMLGYVAEVDPEMLARYRPHGYEDLSREEQQRANPLGYEAGDTVGATGIERAWESYLRGQRGWEKRVVDARGHYRTGPAAERPRRSPARTRPDPRARPAAVDRRGRWSRRSTRRCGRTPPARSSWSTCARGVCSLSTRSRTSTRTTCPAAAGTRAMREAFSRLYADPLRPMLDKTMSGAFQPGSTMKPFSALAALEDHLVDPDHTEKCEGYVAFGRRVFRCSHVHGSVNLARGDRAVVQRVLLPPRRGGRAWIASPASRRPSAWARRRASASTPRRRGGSRPARGTRSGTAGSSGVGFTLNMAIGEGDVTVTPLQLALAYAALANGGTLYQPQVVRAVETSDGAVVQEFPPRIRRQVTVQPENLRCVTDALYDVVNDPSGTAYPARDPPLDVAGKTGTAQTGYVAEEGGRAEDRPGSWRRTTPGSRASRPRGRPRSPSRCWWSTAARAPRSPCRSRCRSCASTSACRRSASATRRRRSPPPAAQGRAPCRGHP